MISGGLTAAYKALVPEFERVDRQQGADRVRAFDGHDRQCDSGAAGSRRTRRRADHGGLCARRPRQAGQGHRRQPGRSREIADRRRGEIRRAEAGHQLGRRGQARAARGEDRSPIPTAPAASMSRPKCSQSSASPMPMKDKARKIPATPVGEIVAKGEAEIGMQQISELKPVPGIDIVGPLPDRIAEDHGVLGRHRHRLQGARGRQGADQVPRLARGPRRDRQERPWSRSKRAAMLPRETPAFRAPHQRMREQRAIR